MKASPTTAGGQTHHHEDDLGSFCSLIVRVARPINERRLTTSTLAIA
jgi:hypothetical protein